MKDEVKHMLLQESVVALQRRPASARFTAASSRSSATRAGSRVRSGRGRAMVGTRRAPHEESTRGQCVENAFGRCAIDPQEPRGTDRCDAQAGHLEKLIPSSTDQDFENVFVSCVLVA